MANEIHNVPGRLRVKIPGIKQHPEQGLKIQAVLRVMQGMERISVNEVTGSVVFRYDPALIDGGQILDKLSEHDLIESDNNIQRVLSPRRSASRPGHVVGKALFGWAVEKALEPTGLSILAALI